MRIEYKHCPNLSIVDTPGLLLGGSADDAAVVGGEGEGGGEDAARRRLQAAGVEQLVRSKIAGDEAIVLCVEESNNWDVAPARSVRASHEPPLSPLAPSPHPLPCHLLLPQVVARVDSSLGRTVVVSTKLDTKFAQFGAADELRTFLDALPLHRHHPRLLGGPYFTSVPAGRVGGKGGHDYTSNDAFRKALVDQEAADVQYVDAVCGHERAGSDNGRRIGVTSLREFLEELLRER